MSIETPDIQSEEAVMPVETKKSRFTRRPLSTLSKTALGTLFKTAILCGTIALLVGSTPLRIIAIVALVVTMIMAGFSLVGWRWAPLLGSLINALLLYFTLAKSSFPLDHLTHPKDAVSDPALSFILFLFVVLFLGSLVMGFGASTAALVQNYRYPQRTKPPTPRWFAASMAGFLGILLGAILIGALAPGASATQASTPPATTYTNGVPTVHMGIASFSQSSVTIAKGSKLLLVDDGNYTHILANGSWQNNQPHPQQETGAPTINHVQTSGNSVQIGPFLTSGTYSIYCVIHPGMTLTVIVQ